MTRFKAVVRAADDFWWRLRQPPPRADGAALTMIGEAAAGYINAVRARLADGIDPRSVDRAGRDARTHAWGCHHDHIVVLLDAMLDQQRMSALLAGSRAARRWAAWLHRSGVRTCDEATRAALDRDTLRASAGLRGVEPGPPKTRGRKM